MPGPRNPLKDIGGLRKSAANLTVRSMNLGLTDKPVIVCASSSGLGKATALEFAREGAHVMLCSRRESELQRAAADIKAATGHEPRYTVVDVSQAADITRLVTRRNRSGALPRLGPGRGCVALSPRAAR